VILDDLMPTWDATRREHRIIDAPMEEVYAAARTADFLDAVRGNAPARAMFAVRSAFERVVSRGRAEIPPEPDHLRLDELVAQGDWVLLGDDEPNEIAFGVVGRFWGGETKWEQIAAEDFASFDRPGFAKIGCNLSLRAYGEGKTLLSYEARTLGTDEASRRAFMRYWHVVSPFVGYIMRSMLRVIERETRVPAK
jgi:hypothetical protein